MNTSNFFLIIFLVVTPIMHSFQEELALVKDIDPSKLLSLETFENTFLEKYPNNNAFKRLKLNYQKLEKDQSQSITESTLDKILYKLINIASDQRGRSPVVDYFIGTRIYPFNPEWALNYYHSSKDYPPSALAQAQHMSGMWQEKKLDDSCLPSILEYYNNASKKISLADGSFFIHKEGIIEKLKFLAREDVIDVFWHDKFYWLDRIKTANIKKQLFSSTEQDEKRVNQEISTIYIQAFQKGITLIKQHPFFNLQEAMRYGDAIAQQLEVDQVQQFKQRIVQGNALEFECLLDYCQRFQNNQQELIKEICELMYAKKTYIDFTQVVLLLTQENRNILVDKNIRELIKSSDPFVNAMLATHYAHEKNKAEFFSKKITDLPYDKKDAETLLFLMMKYVEVNTAKNFSTFVQCHINECENLENMLQKLYTIDIEKYLLWKVLLASHLWTDKDHEQLLYVLKSDEKKEKMLDLFQNTGCWYKCCQESSQDKRFEQYVQIARENPTQSDKDALAEIIKESNALIAQRIKDWGSFFLEQDYMLKKDGPLERYQDILIQLAREYPHSEVLKQSFSDLDQSIIASYLNRKNDVQNCKEVEKNYTGKNIISSYERMWVLAQFGNQYALRWCYKKVVEYSQKKSPKNWHDEVINNYLKMGSRFVDVVLSGMLFAAEHKKFDKLKLFNSTINPILKWVISLAEYPEKENIEYISSEMMNMIDMYNDFLTNDKKRANYIMSHLKIFINSNLVKEKRNKIADKGFQNAINNLEKAIRGYQLWMISQCINNFE